ncbi:FAD-dependent monooxygenase [Candidatus Pelagibacter sp.]|nr:FAD-dependent monooxygenase [Candidatus Pelagibacter sp.]
MNVCIIGDGLTSLSLAKNLINKKINVHIYHENKIQKLTPSRTIGISKNNLEFFKKEIYEISKQKCWKIKKIEIYSQKLKNENLLNFENTKNELFYMVKNDELYKSLKKKLFKSELFKSTIIKKTFYEKQLNKKEYDLIINCDSNNFLAKKYFTKKIEKDYFNVAYTTIIKHKKIENNTAVQIFTEFGPIAFLPISKNETSVVCSLDIKNRKFTNVEIVELINKNNPKYQINNIYGLNSFKLSSSSLRNYYHKNILAFGDLLHRIHPLAGQGFNMTIRDIQILSKIIQIKIELGLHLDISILKDFEKQAKNKNFIFSNGIDFIYEFFNIEKKIKNKNIIKILKIIGKNNNLNNFLIKFADRGMNF